MKSIWQEIREQPPHIRELFMWVSVVITFSVIGFAWFRATTKQFVALLNPPQAGEARILAEERNQPPSPFATLFVSIKDLRATIGELFNLARAPSDFEIDKGERQEAPPIAPRKLPLTGEK